MTFRFADFEIDTARRELRHAGAIVHIEPQVFDLLVHLVRNRDRIVSKDELIDVIWQGRIVSEATLSSRISSARRALGDSGNDQSLIRTLYKRGFRFVGNIDDNSAPAAVASERGPPPQELADDPPKVVPAGESQPLPDTPPTAVLPPPPAGRDPASTGRWARTLLFAIVVNGASVSTGAWWLLSSPSPSATPDAKGTFVPASATEPRVGRAEPPAPSIVALPFINLSGDPKQDYWPTGSPTASPAIWRARCPASSVVSRDTAFTYKGRGVDARQIGRELEVRYLLEGSVLLEGERYA